MVKTKKGDFSTHIPPNHHHLNVMFLQAAMFSNFAVFNESNHCMKFSQMIMKQFNGLSRKSRIRLSSSIKKIICSKCFSFFPHHGLVRVGGKYIKTHCFICKTTKRLFKPEGFICKNYVDMMLPDSLYNIES